MVPLGTWIGDVCAAHLFYLFQEFRASQDRQAQLLPILALATSDHIVNGGQAQLLVIKMPVNHGFSRLSLVSAVIPAHPTEGVNSIRLHQKARQGRCRPAWRSWPNATCRTCGSRTLTSSSTSTPCSAWAPSRASCSPARRSPTRSS